MIDKRQWPDPDAGRREERAMANSAAKKCNHEDLKSFDWCPRKKLILPKKNCEIIKRVAPHHVWLNENK